MSESKNPDVSETPVRERLRLKILGARTHRLPKVIKEAKFEETNAKMKDMFEKMKSEMQISGK